MKIEAVVALAKYREVGLWSAILTSRIMADELRNRLGTPIGDFRCVDDECYRISFCLWIHIECQVEELFELTHLDNASKPRQALFPELSEHVCVERT